MSRLFYLYASFNLVVKNLVSLGCFSKWQCVSDDEGWINLSRFNLG